MTKRFPGPPRRGPAEWFEEAGRVGRRDSLELRAAQAAIDDLPRLPPDIFLSLNLSPATLATEELVALLGQTDSPRIVVELTEHAPVGDYERLSESLDRLRALGVRLATRMPLPLLTEPGLWERSRPQSAAEGA